MIIGKFTLSYITKSASRGDAHSREKQNMQKIKEWRTGKRKYLKQDTKKRIMSLLLAGVLAASAAGTGPVPADAEDAAAYTGWP